MRDETVRETLILTNQLTELGRLNEWVTDVTTRWGLTPRLSFQLDLVLTEAVTNVISHAFTDDGEHSIWVMLYYAPPEVTVELRDHGRAFDPLQQPEATLADNLDEAEIGGLGIHLIRSYAKTCTYERDGDTNILTLTLQESAGIEATP